MRETSSNVLRSIRWTLPARVVAIVAAVQSAGAQPPLGFSGANCSMTNCDCSCIAGEQRKGAEALERLGVQLPSSMTLTPDRVSPMAAMSRLEMLQKDFARLLLSMAYAEGGALSAVDFAAFEGQLQRYIRDQKLPNPPAGWKWDARYVRTLEGQCRAELGRLEPLVQSYRAIEREIDDCRNFAKARNCDPSLQPPASTPPRQQTPPPPVVTPPRQMWPPDQPQPFARHADGRPYVDDALLTRYIAAKRAKDREGGAYWRQGGFGQADFAEVEKRIYDWVRTQGTQGRFELFDQGELDAFQHREAEVRAAYTGNW